MTHDNAVSIIVSLVPEIEKQGAANVLLDYAERENLPPAQLEKLAQVFNTMRTIDHIDKQANTEARGESVPILDVPELVIDYVSRTKQEKAAHSAASFVSSHNPATVDLMSAVMFDAPMAKAASAPAEPAPVAYDKEAIVNAALELEIDARVAMEKLATELVSKLPSLPDGSLDMTAAVADARPHCNQEVLGESLEWLKMASVKPLYGISLDKELTKRAFAHTGECGRLLVAFNEQFAQRKLMRKMAAEVEEGAEKKKLSKEDLDRMAEEDPERVAREIEEMYAENGMTPPGGEPSEAPPAFAKSKSDAKPAGGSAPAAPAASGPPPQQSSRVTKILKAIGKPLHTAGNVIGDAAGKAQGHLDRITSKERFNKDQLSSDIDVEDVRRAIGVRRMIGTDPVLREADPREVLEIYNAIARTNPEIATNMPALRLLMREAVSYEGLTLDSQKQLTDIRANASKSEMQEADNIKRRYAVSGDGPKPKTK